jgi:hypothetical protein
VHGQVAAQSIPGPVHGHLFAKHGEQRKLRDELLRILMRAIDIIAPRYNAGEVIGIDVRL